MTPAQRRRPRRPQSRLGRLRRPGRPGIRGSLRGGAQVRLRAVMIVLAMVLSLFGARLFQLQGVDTGAYAARADAAGTVSLDLPAKRGRILDRNGVPLAESVEGVMLIADPSQTAADAEGIAKILAERLGLDYFDQVQRLTKRGADGDLVRFVYLARRIPSTLASRVLAELKRRSYVGVDSRSDPLRTYPAGDVAANLLGFLGDEGKAQGGLELSFEDLLAGKDGKERYEVGGGNRIPLGDNSREEPVDGKDLRLTIDRDVQWYVQRVLRAAVQAHKGQSGSAVVMDSRTGELLALADYPTFDPGADRVSKDDLGARSLSDVYEPGSVEKVLTAAALLDAGKVTQTTKVKVPSELPVLDRVIGDWFDHPRLRLTMAGVLAKSSNIGTVLLASQFTTHQLWSYLDKFGLGQRTDIGMPSETRGLLPEPGAWSILTRATVAFGQGLSVNALQMAAAVNTLANKGSYISPSLVEGRERTSYGAEVGTDTSTSHRVVSERAARQTAEMMELVTTPDVGTAPGAGIEGYRVAGKTGTAQQVGENCGCYDGSMAVSFAGFAPADKPRFTVYVVVQRPRAGASGGGTAGPVFRKVLTYLMQKYAVVPTGTPPADIPIEWGRHIEY